MARGQPLNLGESTAYGRLAENVMHFARVLRAAGLPIGPDRVLDAVRREGIQKVSFAITPPSDNK